MREIFTCMMAVAAAAAVPVSAKWELALSGRSGADMFSLFERSSGRRSVGGPDGMGAAVHI